mmetsp:Transcript_32902/g.34230  ORF Transcript_32902/g.34230 Transcript_32902/m.34230 type:complete len:96 (+) Transcript_32902:6-293(+)
MELVTKYISDDEARIKFLKPIWDNFSTDGGKSIPDTNFKQIIEEVCISLGVGLVSLDDVVVAEGKGSGLKGDNTMGWETFKDKSRFIFAAIEENN